MKIAFRLTLLMILLPLAACSAQAQSSQDETFEFTSGYTVTGAEGWIVTLDHAGNFSALNYGKNYSVNFLLTEEENAELWDVIDVEKLKATNLTYEPQGRCDSYFILTLKDGTQTHQVSVENDFPIPVDKHIEAIAVKIAALVEKYTGITPHLLWYSEGR